MFEKLQAAPPDPILGLTEAFKSDPREDKINLGVGVFKDENGHTPTLSCVLEAEAALLKAAPEKVYLPITGHPGYCAQVKRLLLEGTAALDENRAVTAQTPGGTGALRVAGDLIARHAPGVRVWMSDPTWANHPKVFGASGLEVRAYRFFDEASHGLDLEGMLRDLQSASPGDVVLLHGCCHNPTGVDPDSAAWTRIATTCAERGLLPLVDIAYQGFADGVREDAEGVRALVEACPEVIIASSYSKNFGMYGERVGAITLVAKTADDAARALSQLKIAIRTNYSNPPRHGASLVGAVLEDPALRARWEEELATMRGRIKAMREALVDGLKAAGVERDFSFLLHQRGMFSFSGLSADQVDRLRDTHAVYAVRSGRINVAAITPSNVGRLCKAIAAVLTALLFFGAPAMAAGAQGRTLEAAAKNNGLQLLEHTAADFDADGNEDLIGACGKDRQIHVCIFREERKNTFSLQTLLPASGGTKLGKLEVRNLVPPKNSPEIILEVYAENPDEKIKRVRVYTAYREPREIFTHVIFRSKDKSKRPAWETKPGVLAYGDAHPGWYFVDVDGDGPLEVVVRKSAQLIKVPRGDDPAWLVTGVREEVFSFMGTADKGSYVSAGDTQLTNFLPGHEVASVTASGAWVEPKLLADLEADALAASVYAATEGDEIPEPTVDFTPFFEHVKDKDYDTAWVENDKGGAGDGEWIELDLGEPVPIRMLRIVPGCVADKRTFRKHNVPTRFEVRFDNGERTSIDLDTPGSPMRPAVAIGKQPLSEERRYAAQAFVFFGGENVSKTVRITLQDAKRQGRGNRTCITELSVH